MFESKNPRLFSDIDPKIRFPLVTARDERFDSEANLIDVYSPIMDLDLRAAQKRVGKGTKKCKRIK